MKIKLGNLLIWFALILHGWRPCRLSDGSDGWRKVESKTVTRRGPLRYAVAHLF